MENKGQAHESLSLLSQREGVPNTMIMDGSLEQTKGLFRKKCRDNGTHVKQTEPYSYWSNAAEGAIRELKRGHGREMVRSGAPKVLWDHCLEREAYIRSLTAHDIYGLNGQVPQTIMTGETADISACALFKWYEWVMFRDTSVGFPEDKMVLGRDLGPAIDIGPAMTRKILKQNGQIVYRSTVRPLTPDEWKDEDMKRRRVEFDEHVHKVLGDPLALEDLKVDPDLADMDTPSYDRYADDDDGEGQTIPDIDDASPDTHDRYVGAEVELSIGDSVMSGKVVRRKRDPDGIPKGRAHSNPILDTRTYEVEFPDGQIAEYSANIIAQNMYSQCDSEGNQYLLLKAIVDWQKDETATTRERQYIRLGNKNHIESNKHLRKTTKGWKLCVEWRDGTTSWERLADLKESNPIEVAEFAVAQGIDKEPAFAWWVPYVLSRRNRIVAAVNKRYHKRTHKYGIEVPKTYDDCVRIDTANGNTLWQDAVTSEMEKVRIAFKILDDGDKVPPTYQQIRCHLVFDVKMEDFR